MEGYIFPIQLSDDRRVTEHDEGSDFGFDLSKDVRDRSVHSTVTNIKVGSTKKVKPIHKLSGTTEKSCILSGVVQEKALIYSGAAESSKHVNKRRSAASNDSHIALSDVNCHHSKDDEDCGKVLSEMVLHLDRRNDESCITQFVTDVSPQSTKWSREKILKFFKRLEEVDSEYARDQK